MCVPTRNMLGHEGCIDEERAQRKQQEKEASVSKEAHIQLERNGSHKTEGKHKHQRRGVDRNKTNMPIAHRNFLSVQSSVSVITHDTLNTLGERIIPRADKNRMTVLLQPQGQRQRRTDITGVVNTNDPIACRNKPTAEKGLKK